MENYVRREAAVERGVARRVTRQVDDRIDRSIEGDCEGMTFALLLSNLLDSCGRHHSRSGFNVFVQPCFDEPLECNLSCVLVSPNAVDCALKSFPGKAIDREK